jgi:hypothetical protein
MKNLLKAFGMTVVVLFLSIGLIAVIAFVVSIGQPK